MRRSVILAAMVRYDGGATARRYMLQGDVCGDLSVSRWPRDATSVGSCDDVGAIYVRNAAVLIDRSLSFRFTDFLP
jgi:hypothetical protein